MEMRGIWLFAAAYAASALCLGAIACHLRGERTAKGIIGIMLLPLFLFGYVAHSMGIYKSAQARPATWGEMIIVAAHMLSFMIFMLFTLPLKALDGSLYGFVANAMGYATLYGIISALQIMAGLRRFGKHLIPDPYELY